MFVVRYLMAALAVMTGVLAWGIGAGYSGWQAAGLAVLSVLALQALILGYVAVAAARRARDSAHRGRKRCDQLVILPR